MAQIGVMHFYIEFEFLAGCILVWTGLLLHSFIRALVRDMKLASDKTWTEQLYRALLQSCFVFLMNASPFGSRERIHKKPEMLAYFVDCHTASSASFRAFGPLIAADFGVACEMEDD